jgi:hypothetical protein
MYPLKFPVIEERIQDISGLKKCDRDLPKSDFTCFHPRCYFSVSSTTIVKKSTQGGWRLLLFTPFMVQTRAQNWINHDKHSTIHYYLLFAHPQITTLRHMIRI